MWLPRLSVFRCSISALVWPKISFLICQSWNEQHLFPSISMSYSSTGLESATSKGTFDSWWMIWKHSSQQFSLLSPASSTACLTRSVYAVYVLLWSEVPFLWSAALHETRFGYFSLLCRFLVKPTRHWKDGCLILPSEGKRRSLKMEWSEKTACGTHSSSRKCR